MRTSKDFEIGARVKRNLVCPWMRDINDDTVGTVTRHDGLKWLFVLWDGHDEPIAQDCNDVVAAAEPPSAYDDHEPYESEPWTYRR